MDDELKNYLEKDEEILWSYHKVKNFEKEFSYNCIYSDNYNNRF